MKKTTDKAKIIYETSTSFCLIIPAIALTTYFIYLNFKMIYNLDYVMYLLSSIISWCVWYFLSYQKKLLLTEHKIYITKGKKKIHSLSLLKDIERVSFSQKGLGNRFNYGTLEIITKEGDTINYYFLSEPKVSYQKIVYAMESKYIKINPDFQRTIIFDEVADSITKDEIDEWDDDKKNNKSA